MSNLRIGCRRRHDGSYRERVHVKKGVGVSAILPTTHPCNTMPRIPVQAGIPSIPAEESNVVKVWKQLIATLRLLEMEVFPVEEENTVNIQTIMSFC
ncbi:hypothetical protein BaRGS_00018383 [Batillaria attramentaria]|uniref:Uncharacterized protein n=1 Tax=Batillaria attramentaria TaxID=370345 RepID=A0ABD0KU28_9CAEN